MARGWLIQAAMSRYPAHGIAALLLTLALCGSTSCARPADPAPLPTAIPAEERAPAVPSTPFSPEYVGSGLPRAGGENPVDLYAAAAVDLPSGLEWLNTSRPLSLAQLRGKVVLIDFWNYGCIECLQNFPELERLQREYSDTLVVIGVHSGQVAGENQIEALRQVIQGYGIHYPVAYDPQQRMWYDYGVQTWATLILVDPAGALAHMHVGQGAYRAFRPLIGALVDSFGARNHLDDTPLEGPLK